MTSLTAVDIRSSAASAASDHPGANANRSRKRWLITGTNCHRTRQSPPFGNSALASRFTGSIFFARIRITRVKTRVTMGREFGKGHLALTRHRSPISNLSLGHETTRLNNKVLRDHPRLDGRGERQLRDAVNRCVSSCEIINRVITWLPPETSECRELTSGVRSLI